MPFVKNIKGVLVDIESIVPMTTSFCHKRLRVDPNVKVHESMATRTVYYLTKKKLFPEFSPFNHSLKEIYGSDFFKDKTDLWNGDAPYTPFTIIENPLMIIEKILSDKKYQKLGKASCLATRRMKLSHYITQLVLINNKEVR